MTPSWPMQASAAPGCENLPGGAGHPAGLWMLCSSAGGASRARLMHVSAQVPYYIEVFSKQYKDILNVYNANLTSSNVTTNGSAVFEVQHCTHAGPPLPPRARTADPLRGLLGFLSCPADTAPDLL